MLGLVLALSAATTTADITPSLTSAAPWWEKVTYTMSGDGEQQACRYESSLAGARSCDRESDSNPLKKAASSSGSAYMKITVERRFTPGSQPDVKLQPGDTLLGGQVMALAIDEAGSVQSCRVVGASGDVRPAYGCDEAKAERFEAGARQPAEVTQAFLTILVYGHEEELA